jgi:sigma-E factor negative regulatory protein RseC
MFTVGVVKSVDGQTAKVFVEIGGGCCDHCEKDVCDVSTQGVETDALNPVHARVGQKVRISMKTFTYVKGALVLFILPICGLFVGAFLGRVYLPAYIHSAGADILSAVGGIFLLGVSLILAKLLSAKMGKKVEHRPVIESIIEK